MRLLLISIIPKPDKLRFFYMRPMVAGLPLNVIVYIDTLIG